MHLDNAENTFIDAAQGYLEVSENFFLDKKLLQATQRALDKAYKTQRQKLEIDEHAPINPKVGELYRKIEQGFNTLEEREESSSSTISIDGKNEHLL